VISTEGHEEAAMSVRRDGRTLTIKRQGTVKPWSVCLRNVFGVSGVEGGSSERGNGGIVILPDKGVEMVTVKLGEIR
jgi:alpha-D-xyloside xylohydrolase